MTDPSAGTPPTDVLAAEEFGVPAPDPGLCPEDLVLPADLVGDEPRDVLAAEEFAMPAPDEARVRPRTVVKRSLPVLRLAAINLPPLLSAAWLLRRLRRRQAGSGDGGAQPAEQNAGD